MQKIDAYVLRAQESGAIDQLPLKRDWMDQTFGRHAYHCFPLSLANRLGWGVSFPEDIVFIWDGINDSTPHHIKIISGEKYVHPDRGNRTLSFNTGIYFHSRENVSLLTMPVPNLFIDGTQCMTTVISTSVLNNDFPVSWIVTKPNVEITIPAGTPVAAILPISLKSITSSRLTIRKGFPDWWNTQAWRTAQKLRGIFAQSKNSVGDWSHLYRDAVDQHGNSSGSHELKKVVMEIKYEKDN